VTFLGFLASPNASNGTWGAFWLALLVILAIDAVAIVGRMKWMIVLGLLCSAGSITAGILTHNSKAYFAGIVGLIATLGTVIALSQRERAETSDPQSRQADAAPSWTKWGRWLFVPGIVVLGFGFLNAMYYPYYALTGQETWSTWWIVGLCLIGFIGPLVALSLYFDAPHLAVSPDARFTLIGAVGILFGVLTLFIVVAESVAGRLVS
jgi:hypothetical protein